MNAFYLTVIYALGVACFGAIGLFRTWSGLDSVGASFVRGVWGAVALFMVGALVNKTSFRTNFTYLLRCIVWGGLLGVAILVYFKCMDYSNQSVGALFLFLQVIWYPIYLKLLSSREAEKTRWSIYLLVNAGTILGSLFALGFIGHDGTTALNLKAVSYGFLVSFMAYVYFVIGRWLFFANNDAEKNLLSRICSKLGAKQLFARLLDDELQVKNSLSPFWESYQKTLYQSVGMVMVGFIYIPTNGQFFASLLETSALLNGIALGVLCLAMAFFLITYADASTVTNNDGTVSMLNTKVKGLSMQIELVLALILGHFILGEKLGAEGIIGCVILLLSYATGVLYAEKPLVIEERG